MKFEVYSEREPEEAYEKAQLRIFERMHRPSLAHSAKKF